MDSWLPLTRFFPYLDNKWLITDIMECNLIDIIVESFLINPKIPVDNMGMKDYETVLDCIQIQVLDFISDFLYAPVI